MRKKWATTSNRFKWLISRSPRYQISRSAQEEVQDVSRINSYGYDEPERRSSFGTGKKGNNSIIQIYSRHSSRSSLSGQKVEDNRRSVHAPAVRGTLRTRRERQTTVAALRHGSADICEWTVTTCSMCVLCSCSFQNFS